MDESADAAAGPQEGPVGPGDLGQAPTPFQKLQERLRNAQKETHAVSCTTVVYAGCHACKCI